MKRVTLRDIAREAGVDKSTVSYALRNHPSIPERTCRRLQKLAREMGYRPDPTLAQLGSQRWRSGEGAEAIRPTLAILLERKAYAPSLPGALRTGFERRCRALGYHSEAFFWEDWEHPRRLGEVLYARGIRGLVVGGLDQARDLSGFRWDRFCSVAALAAPFSPPLDTVDFDYGQQVTLCWEAAVRAGYRRIGILTLQHDFENLGDLLRCGQIAYLEQRRTEGAPALFTATWGLQEYSPEALFRFCREKQLDALMTAFFHPYGDLTAAGIRIPAELGFAMMLRAAIYPEVSGTTLGHDRLGSRAVDLLESALRMNRFGLPERPEQLLLPPDWQEGATLPGPGRQRSRPMRNAHRPVQQSTA